MNVHSVICGKQLLPVNLATAVRRNKTKEITEEAQETDKEPVRKENGEPRKQGH